MKRTDKSPAGRAAVMVVALAAIITWFSVAARADAPPHERPSRQGVKPLPQVADRWAELAAAHKPDVCARCRPRPGATVSVAEVVRRMRHEAAAPVSAPIGAPDVAADLKHVSAVAADDRDRQILRIADELALSDVLAGASFAAALPPGRGQNGAMLVVVGIWVRRDRRAALDWAQSLPNEGTRSVAVHEVTRRLVAADVRDALALVSDLPEGPGRDDALCSIAQHWTKIDRTAALVWVRGLAESPTKARILVSAEFEFTRAEATPE